MICLDCPRVGDTYNTADPSGASNAFIMSIIVASLLLPHRRPAAITLKRVLSLKTSCCHFSNSKLRFIDFTHVYDISIYSGVIQSSDVNANLR